VTLFGFPVADVANVAIIATAFAAFVTFGLHYYQLKAQSDAVDLQNLYKVMGEINNGWEKLQLCDAEHWEFYFGQLLASYELACYVANRGIIGKAAVEPLRDQIVEVLLNLVTDKVLLTKMKAVASGEHTYKEIIQFSKTHKKAFEDQWQYIQEAGLAGE